MKDRLLHFSVFAFHWANGALGKEKVMRCRNFTGGKKNNAKPTDLWQVLMDSLETLECSHLPKSNVSQVLFISWWKNHPLPPQKKLYSSIFFSVKETDYYVFLIQCVSLFPLSSPHSLNSISYLEWKDQIQLGVRVLAEDKQVSFVGLYIRYHICC